MILIIAEKPIAARGIAEILSDGKAKEFEEKRAPFLSFEKEGKQYLIIPLRGHVLDVEFPKQYSQWVGTDLKTLCNAEILYLQAEKNIISLLHKNAPEVSEVIIATDYDREGESIGLEAINTLKQKNPSLKIQRANFSAITKEDLEKAFSELEEVQYELAHSADARREIDLLWGSVLTRFLSIVSGAFGKEFISAGRVQTPVLALIVQREKERLAFKPEKYWELEALFEKDKVEFKAKHKKGRFKEKEKAEEVLAKKTDECTVSNVKKSKRTLKKPVPFNTTEFLRASTALGFSAGRAMSIAENLYQRGFTSYPRTDNSVYPSSLDFKKLLLALKEESKFFADAEKLLAQKKLVPSKGKFSKDHPPIHPVALPKEQLDPQHWKIYELICRRFFATLAEDALTENLQVEILMKDEPFNALGQRYLEKGWKEFYPYSKAEEVLLPEMEKGDTVLLKELNLFDKETQPPGRYSQGSLIRLMSQLGLGTKSTRAEILQKLYSRGYISGNKAITPNKIAFAVIDSLQKYGEKIVKPEMTVEVEKEMDEIVAKKKTKEEVTDDSRKKLENILDELLKNKNLIGSLIRSARREDKKLISCTGENCDGMLVMRKGRTGKRFLGCSNYPKCTVTYPLPQFGRIEPTEKECPECTAPVIKVFGKRVFQMCIDPNCKTKENWGKRKKAKAENKEEKSKEEKKEEVKEEKEKSKEEEKK